MDSIDYEERDWVSDSGWPINEGELGPFYKRAERFVHLKSPAYDEAAWKLSGEKLPRFDFSKVALKATIYCREPNLARDKREAMSRQKNLDIVLNATVVSLDSKGPAGPSTAEFRSRAGRKGSISAKYFVICCGGVENARLLLASTKGCSAGLGNEYDVVGRFFQDHPSVRTATITQNAKRVQDRFRMIYRGGNWYFPKIAVSNSVQRSERILNTVAYPVADYDVKSLSGILRRLRDTRSVFALHRAELGTIAKGIPVIAREVWTCTRRRVSPALPAKELFLQVFTEQVPDRENRVTLGSARDRFGTLVAKVMWKMGEEEMQTLKVATECIGGEFQRAGLGTVHILPHMKESVDRLSGLAADGYHHAGTTRMGSDPKTSVVDPRCRLHRARNVYICGGSVMPTSGYANPTLTIIALAIRAADDIRLQFTAGMAE